MLKWSHCYLLNSKKKAQKIISKQYGKVVEGYAPLRKKECAYMHSQLQLQLR